MCLRRRDGRVGPVLEDGSQDVGAKEVREAIPRRRWWRKMVQAYEVGVQTWKSNSVEVLVEGVAMEERGGCTQSLLRRKLVLQACQQASGVGIRWV